MITLPLCFSLVLMLAAFVLIVVYCALLSRVWKKLREKDSVGILRENRRMTVVLTAVCVCSIAGYGLFDYTGRAGASILGCLLNGAGRVLPLVPGGAWAHHVFHKKGMELKEENQLD